MQQLSKTKNKTTQTISIVECMLIHKERYSKYIICILDYIIDIANNSTFKVKISLYLVSYTKKRRVQIVSKSCMHIFCILVLYHYDLILIYSRYSDLKLFDMH